MGSAIFFNYFLKSDIQLFCKHYHYLNNDDDDNVHLTTLRHAESFH